MTEPVTSTLAALASLLVIAFAFLFLGAVLLLLWARGGQSFRLKVKGLGVSVDLVSDSEEGTAKKEDRATD